MRFQPYPGMPLQIGALATEFVAHPLADLLPDDVYAIEGGEAIVYQLYNPSADEYLALKLIKGMDYRREIARITPLLQPLASIAGLTLCQRICLQRAAFPRLIQEYPELEFGLVTPWLAGTSWAGFIQNDEERSGYAPAVALTLALKTAQIFWELEAHHIVHTDIAGSNLLLSQQLQHIELIDVEGVYAPHFPKLSRHSLGTPGYQHHHLPREGQRHLAGDRFAGAILLTEMLAWADPLVRMQTPVLSESLFTPDELQAVASSRFAYVCDALQAICPATVPLLQQAWYSATLAECPTMEAWAFALVEQQIR